ncbi:hypothetical protein Lepto7376_3970 [[Leptolyngbya] sp. PCC 7376]|uniref:hypothetical protein n=1 Tax=[Leptolyngbya] sp. PCC 7376 TaxID=111781 RepID=UPI00029F3945|nr:hypothetical protein [[Leptolyngbya] sp. PCC 7376]AFY40110.1 hypothetical protein Lepto7376_3970 [[Leptolyngbya] sp. PCC 7376]
MTATLEFLDLDKNRPAPGELITQLLALEKSAKKERRVYGFEQLLGQWRLTFITGTKKAQKQAGNVLGKGRYLPGFVTVAIAYSEAPDNDPTAEWQKGTVLNSVKFGLLNLAVSGAIKFQAQKRLLAFDFTHITVKLGGIQLYDGDMRGGDEAAAKFHATPIGKLPFFSYFYVAEKAIAARGKGGGVALWTKLD